MVVIGERSNIDPLENFNFKFEPMVRASIWYPGVTYRPPNGSDGSYIRGGKHYFPVDNNFTVLYPPKKWQDPPGAFIYTSVVNFAVSMATAGYGVLTVLLYSNLPFMRPLFRFHLVLHHQKDSLTFGCCATIIK